MAAFQVREDSPERMILTKGSASLGGLIGMGIFAIVTCASLAGMVEEGGTNPVMIVILLVIGLALVSSFINSLSRKRVVIDNDAQTATRTDSFFFIPLRNQEMTFQAIRNVQVARVGNARASRADRLKIWQTRLMGSNGETLIVNESGTRAEMDALALQVSDRVSRPVIQPTETIARDSSVRAAPDSPFAETSARMEAEQAAANAAVVATSARFISDQKEAFGSDVQVQTESSAAQVAAFGSDARVQAESRATQAAAFESDMAKQSQMAQSQVTAFQSDAQSQAAMVQAQLGASMPALTTSALLTMNQASAFGSDVRVQAQATSTQASAFSSDKTVQAQMYGAQVSASEPFVTASMQLANKQAEAAAMEYAMPPMATLPQMPALLSFAPTTEMPTFAPMDSGYTAPDASLTSTPEINTVPAHANETRAQASELARQARQMLQAQHYAAAKEMLFQLLKINPADASAQNDLGIVYWRENKLPEAETAFRRAVALDPFQDRARYNLGVLLEKLKKHNEAYEQFKVGALNASRSQVEKFNAALRGQFQEPIPSKND